MYFFYLISNSLIIPKTTLFKKKSCYNLFYRFQPISKQHSANERIAYITPFDVNIDKHWRIPETNCGVDWFKTVENMET